MLSQAPGLNIKMVGHEYACTLSIAQELFVVVGNILCVKRYGEEFLGELVKRDALDCFSPKLITDIQIHIARVCALDKIFTKRVKKAFLLAQAGSRVSLLRRVNVVFDVEPPLTLAHRRRKGFETLAEVYAFVAGMCGVGVHTTGDIEVVDLRVARKSIQDWWRQLLVAQELCAQLRAVFETCPVEVADSKRVLKGIDSLSLELTEAAWCFRSKIALGS